MAIFACITRAPQRPIVPTRLNRPPHVVLPRPASAFVAMSGAGKPHAKFRKLHDDISANSARKRRDRTDAESVHLFNLTPLLRPRASATQRQYL